MGQPFATFFVFTNLNKSLDSLEDWYIKCRTGISFVGLINSYQIHIDPFSFGVFTNQILEDWYILEVLEDNNGYLPFRLSKILEDTNHGHLVFSNFGGLVNGSISETPWDSGRHRSLWSHSRPLQQHWLTGWVGVEVSSGCEIALLVDVVFFHRILNLKL